MEIEFQCAGLKRRLSSDTELVLYRVFQEGLRNVVKYARAKFVRIQLTYSHPKVIFVIKDNGVGFDTNNIGLPDDHRRMGIGLLSMKERVASQGGTLLIRSSSTKGTAIRVELVINGNDKS